MKLFTSIGPNPRVVHMFLHEKGIDPAEHFDVVQLDIMKAENRQADYLEVNPGGQSPCLVLDDGQLVSEITTICEYVEERHPEPVLIGASPEERAETRMWTRRVDLGICEPLANGFRFSQGLPMFQDRMLCRPEAADGLKAIAQDRLGWLDQQLADGRSFLCGDRFSMADVLLYAFLDFGNQVGQPLDRSREHVAAWFDRVAERPSVAATAG